MLNEYVYQTKKVVYGKSLKIEAENEDEAEEILRQRLEGLWPDADEAFYMLSEINDNKTSRISWKNYYA